MPLISGTETVWKTAAFSQFHRNPRVTPDKKRYMGFSMVTARYHYVEWKYWDHVQGLAGNEVLAVELYDLQADPDENVNVGVLEDSKPLIEQLSGQLQRGWRSAAPK